MLYGFLGEYKAIVKLGLYTGKFLSSVTNNVPQPRGWYESNTHTHTLIQQNVRICYQVLMKGKWICLMLKVKRTSEAAPLLHAAQMPPSVSSD